MKFRKNIAIILIYAIGMLIMVQSMHAFYNSIELNRYELTDVNNENTNEDTNDGSWEDYVLFSEFILKYSTTDKIPVIFFSNSNYLLGVTLLSEDPPEVLPI